MHMLGIANGSADGNSEIALKIALTAAQETDPSTTITWVHIPSVSIPLNPKPLMGAADLTLGANESMSSGTDKHAVADDRQALLDAFMDADAYIFATPIYSRSPAGSLMGVLDRILGPFTDAAFAEEALEQKRNGNPIFANVNIDCRLLKPRVAGFIAVGGSTTTDQITMALPILHNIVCPMHVKVVDQVVFQGCGTPGSILARNDGRYIERTVQMGKNAASQMRKQFDDAKYLGDEPEGACPYCHLVKIDLFYGEDNKIGCIGCGAEGHLSIGADGIVRPKWNMNCGVSAITMAGKKLHVQDIRDELVDEAKDIQKCADFEVKRQHWRELKFHQVQLPSVGEQL